MVLRAALPDADQALRDHLSCLLAPYKVPERVTPVAALPKTVVGKIDKQALRHPERA